jgi:hypothetical protein
MGGNDEAGFLKSPNEAKAARTAISNARNTAPNMSPTTSLGVPRKSRLILFYLETRHGIQGNRRRASQASGKVLPAGEVDFVPFCPLEPRRCPIFWHQAARPEAQPQHEATVDVCRRRSCQPETVRRRATNPHPAVFNSPLGSRGTGSKAGDGGVSSAAPPCRAFLRRNLDTLQRRRLRIPRGN